MTIQARILGTAAADARDARHGGAADYARSGRRGRDGRRRRRDVRRPRRRAGRRRARCSPSRCIRTPSDCSTACRASTAAASGCRRFPATSRRRRSFRPVAGFAPAARWRPRSARKNRRWSRSSPDITRPVGSPPIWRPAATVDFTHRREATAMIACRDRLRLASRQPSPAEPLLVVDRAVQVLSRAPRRVCPRQAVGEGGRRRELHARQGRNARARRRKRLRQDDRRPHAAATDPRDERRGARSTAASILDLPRSAAATAPARRCRSSFKTPTAR